MCGLKQQPICASLCDGDPIIFACLKQVLHFLQPRLATLTSLAGFCIFQPAPSRLQHFSARPPAWFSGRLKSPGFRQAGSLAARQAQPSFSLLRLCTPSGGECVKSSELPLPPEEADFELDRTTEIATLALETLGPSPDALCARL